MSSSLNEAYGESAFSTKGVSIVLPKGVSDITFPEDFNGEAVLPDSLKTIRFGRAFNSSVKLPVGLESVTFGECFDQPGLILPSTLKNVYFKAIYRHYLEMPVGCTRWTREVLQWGQPLPEIHESAFAAAAVKIESNCCPAKDILKSDIFRTVPKEEVIVVDE